MIEDVDVMPTDWASLLPIETIESMITHMSEELGAPVAVRSGRGREQFAEPVAFGGVLKDSKGGVASDVAALIQVGLIQAGLIQVGLVQAGRRDDGGRKERRGGEWAERAERMRGLLIAIPTTSPSPLSLVAPSQVARALDRKEAMMVALRRLNSAVEKGALHTASERVRLQYAALLQAASANDGLLGGALFAIRDR